MKLLIMGYEVFRGQVYVRPEEEKARQPSLSLPEPRESQCCLRTFFVAVVVRKAASTINKPIHTVTHSLTVLFFMIVKNPTFMFVDISYS